MRKYINKESVLDLVTDCDMSRDEVIDCIEAIPAFDVAPVRHGRWNKEWGNYKCSLCGALDDFADNYCPNCGVKMDEGTKR